MLDGAVRDQSPHTPVVEEPAPWATGRPDLQLVPRDEPRGRDVIQPQYEETN